MLVRLPHGTAICAWSCVYMYFHMLDAEQTCCNCQVQQRQKEYEALHHGALQRLQEWKADLLHQQGA